MNQETETPDRIRFELRLSAAEKELFRLAAARDGGRSLASWVRARLRKIAEQELAE